MGFTRTHDVRFGSEAAAAAKGGRVRFTPESCRGCFTAFLDQRCDDVDFGHDKTKAAKNQSQKGIPLGLGRLIWRGSVDTPHRLDRKCAGLKGPCVVHK
jgi:hypothetical protein